MAQLRPGLESIDRDAVNPQAEMRAMAQRAKEDRRRDKQARTVVK